MAEEYETKEVAYLIKEQDGKRRYITNKPNHPEDAIYNIQRRNARRLTGLEEINIQWNEHLIETRSEEHTSELQSRFDLVCRLLLEKKNNINREKIMYI